MNASDSSLPDGRAPLPTAVLAPRTGWWWIVPLVALIVVVILAAQAWFERGVRITLIFVDGHGITVGDSVKHRGIVVGKVRRVGLAEGGETVEVLAALSRDAADLAREGSRFWLVRPEIGLSRLAGLETIVGARYIAVHPGDGSPMTRFVGLDQPPIVAQSAVGDLELIILAPRRGSLAPGSPVVYRQVQVGTVASVRLASDAAAVEARIHVEARYAPLIREGTRFWDVGGLDIGIGLSGVRATVESTELLLRGGLAFATPSNAGPQVATGTRFSLDLEPPRDWNEWRPPVRLAE